jgi:ketosteroid isomerase-like protein
MRGTNGMLRLRTLFLIFLCGCILLGGATPAAAQKDKKKKKVTTPAETTLAPPALPDVQQIDIAISEMLGAWQLGDGERLHKAYADDVSVVSGAWQAPLVGWASFFTEYQKQRARVQQVRMDRENTYVRVTGNFAWACYQWEFSAVADGQQTGARGQTSLIFEKRNGNWVIVHNHTSLIQSVSQPVQAPPAAVTPPPKP